MDESDMDTRFEELVNRFKTLVIADNMLDPIDDEVLLLNKLQGLVTNIKWSPTDATDMFDALLQRFESNDRTNLLSWMLEMLHCIEINYITPSWRRHNRKQKTRQTLIELIQDKTVTDHKLKKCLSHDREKKLDEILEEIREQKLNHVDEKLLGEVKDIVSSVNGDLTSNIDESQRCGLKKDLLKLCRAVKETQSLTPRLTQMVSWCIMALSKTGQLIQVGTGEGKSCIVAMFAAFRAIRGDNVDILTSSPVLAERDMEEWQNFYDILKISVSCNTNKQNEDLKKCYECQVVYGTAHEFAGDWLCQRFERTDIFGKRTFQCAILDEVDSLMLDKGTDTVYISSDMPALQHLNPLLALIWHTANQYSQRMYTDKDSVLRAVEEKIKHAVHYTPCDMSQGKSRCYVPGFLSGLVKSNLKVWIENALKSQVMTKDHEYVTEAHGLVPVDYSSTGVVQNFRILSDGLQQFLEMKHPSEAKLSDMTAITNYMSNVGLFQKYGGQIFGISGTLGQKAETETLQKIYKDIKTCQIPSFKRRKLFEVEGVIVDDEEEWVEKICDVVTEQINPSIYRAERAVLVICETIKRAKDLYDVLGDVVPNIKIYINNNMDNSVVFDEIQAEDVIVATNLAGRGTDLKVSDKVNRAGGLFVVQTFLPENARVEAQAFGRTARQGSPGSAQLIVCSSHLPEPLKLLALKSKLFHSLLENISIPVSQSHFVMQFRLYHKSHRDNESKSLLLTLLHILIKTSDSGLKTVKDARDLFAAERLTRFSECDIPYIQRKEELFDLYLHMRDGMYNSNNKPADSYLSTLNEFWGLWLLTNFSENISIKDLKTKLTTHLGEAMKKIGQTESPSSNLHHYTASGNKLRKKGHLAESIKMYTKAIQEDPCWAAIAYYNRAFTALTQKDGDQDPSRINQALKDLQNALKSVELFREQVMVTQKYSRQRTGVLHSDSITRFESHMTARCKVLLFFMENINEAIKRVERARDIGGNVKVTEILAHFLVPRVHLLPLAVLSAHTLIHIRTRNPLKMHQIIGHPSFDIIIELKRLESLGLTHVYSLDTRFSLGGFFTKIFRDI